MKGRRLLEVHLQPWLRTLYGAAEVAFQHALFSVYCALDVGYLVGHVIEDGNYNGEVDREPEMSEERASYSPTPRRCAAENTGLIILRCFLCNSPANPDKHD